jgi:hypothetical protein
MLVAEGLAEGVGFELGERIPLPGAYLSVVSAEIEFGKGGCEPTQPPHPRPGRGLPRVGGRNP